MLYLSDSIPLTLLRKQSTLSPAILITWTYQRRPHGLPQFRTPCTPHQNITELPFTVTLIFKDTAVYSLGLPFLRNKGYDRFIVQIASPPSRFECDGCVTRNARSRAGRWFFVYWLVPSLKDIDKLFSLFSQFTALVENKYFFWKFVTISIHPLSRSKFV